MCVCVYAIGDHGREGFCREAFWHFGSRRCHRNPPLLPSAAARGAQVIPMTTSPPSTNPQQCIHDPSSVHGATEEPFCFTWMLDKGRLSSKEGPRGSLVVQEEGIMETVVAPQGLGVPWHHCTPLAVADSLSETLTHSKRTSTESYQNKARPESGHASSMTVTLAAVRGASC